MATITAELEQKISEFTGDPDQIKSIVQDLVASTPDAPELSLYVARKGKRGRKPHVTEEQWALWSNGEIHALVQGVDFSKPIRTMRSILCRRANMAGLKFRGCVDGTTIRVQALPKGKKFTLARTSPPGGNPSMQDQRRSILEAFARGDLTMEEACAQCGGSPSRGSMLWSKLLGWNWSAGLRSICSNRTIWSDSLVGRYRSRHWRRRWESATHTLCSC